MANRRFKCLFFTSYTILNLTMIGTQVMFISMYTDPMQMTRVLIAVQGSLLMVLNFIMAYKYQDIVSKFMTLLNAQEEDKCYILVRKAGMYTILGLLIFRAISEDVLRFGSALNEFIFGDNYTDFVFNDPDSGWIMMINLFLFVQSLVPFLIGIFILIIYLWFGNSNYQAQGEMTTQPPTSTISSLKPVFGRFKSNSVMPNSNNSLKVDAVQSDSYKPIIEKITLQANSSGSLGSKVISVDLSSLKRSMLNRNLGLAIETLAENAN